MRKKFGPVRNVVRITQPKTHTLRLSRNYAKEQGWYFEKTEYWMSFPRDPDAPGRAMQLGGVRKDLFGCIDALVLTGSTLLAVQITTVSNYSSRAKKVLQSPGATAWARSGGLVEIWCWARAVSERGRRQRFTLRREDLTAQLLFG